MDTLGFDQVPPRNTNTVLGDSYIIGRRIGRGAMGEVYEAQHVRLPGPFAVKLLLPELQGNQEAFARFCREAEIMSQLRHPNIVQIFDFNVAPDSRPYFVMEYLQGRDLEARLQAGPLPLPAVTRIVDAVASALALAHAHGVVHRDLKPANVFLATVDGQTDELVKVLDFGISKVRGAAAQISQAVDRLGTPSYMSPEQARGQVTAVDGRTDQFALGAIAYRMLTGQEPFQGDDTAAVLYQVVHEDPPPLSLFLPPGWDTGPLQAVLERALAKQPERRYGGMMELARAFDDAAERTIGVESGGRPERSPPRLPAAEALDQPPPVRTPTPLVLGPPRQLPFRPPPEPRVIDWEAPSGIDKVPTTHVRGAVFALLVLAFIATMIATGWYKRLPALGAAVRQKVHEWTRPPNQPAATAPAPAPQPEAAARIPAAPAGAPSPATGEAAAPEVARADGRPVAAPPPEASAAAAPAAEKPRPPRRRAARAQRERRATPFAAPPPAALPADTPGAPGQVTVPTAPGQLAPQAVPGQTTPPTAPGQLAPPSAPGQAAPPGAPAQAPAPASPSLDGRAFEIAPPTPMQPRERPLAPMPDDTLPPSP
jgi:serine/threonine-protein kinase